MSDQKHFPGLDPVLMPQLPAVLGSQEREALLLSEHFFYVPDEPGSEDPGFLRWQRAFLVVYALGMGLILSQSLKVTQALGHKVESVHLEETNHASGIYWDDRHPSGF